MSAGGLRLPFRLASVSETPGYQAIMLNRILTSVLVVSLLACSDSNNNPPPPAPAPEPEPTFELNAEIRRTEYGIPHVVADDWQSLGYGFGYAYAQDNYCVTMREIVYASGRSSELFGEPT